MYLNLGNITHWFATFATLDSWAHNEKHRWPISIFFIFSIATGHGAASCLAGLGPAEFDRCCPSGQRWLEKKTQKKRGDEAIFWEWTYSSLLFILQLFVFFGMNFIGIFGEFIFQLRLKATTRWPLAQSRQQMTGDPKWCRLQDVFFLDVRLVKMWSCTLCLVVLFACIRPAISMQTESQCCQDPF